MPCHLFSKQPPNDSGKIVSLKIARLSKRNGIFSEKPDKSITLTSGEIDALIGYIQEYYTPLNTGLTEFIPVDADAAKLFSKIRDLDISDDEVVGKLISSGILTDNLSVAITAAERKCAITEGGADKKLDWILCPSPLP